MTFNRERSRFLVTLALGFMLWQNGKYVDVPMARVQGNWVSRACEKNPSCDALAARKKASLAKEAPRTADTNGWVGHPANDYCLSLGAKARILRDSGRRQWNFCVFNDGSMIDSWALVKAAQDGKKAGR